MARGNDPGKDFDSQYNASNRRAQPKRDAGRGPWQADKAIRDSGKMKPPSGGGDDSCVSALALLGVIGWLIGETVSRAL